MEKRKASQTLEEKIQEKEMEQAAGTARLKEQFDQTIEGLKPANLIKSTLESPALKRTATNAAISIAVGIATEYLTRKLVVKNSNSPVPRLAGAVLQLGASSIVANNSDKIREVAGAVLRNLFRSKKKAEPAVE